MKTTWNLGLLYKNETDPQIEKDVRATESAYSKFEKTYKGKTDYLKNETKLLKALQDFEVMIGGLELYKPVRYFSFIQCLNSKDDVARAKVTQLTERYTKNDQKIAFFELSLSKIPKDIQVKFLASKKLAHFHYFLKTIFARSKHNLSEAEEKIMSLKSIPAYNQWVESTEKVVNKATLEFKGKTMPLSEAIFKISDLPLPDRYELHDKVSVVLGTLTDTAESEINAVFINKKIDDELRGYTEAYDATVLGYQNDKKSVKTLVSTVTEANHIAHRFYTLKAKLLGLKKLRYADRAVGIAKEVPKATFEEGVAILREVFGSLDSRYLAILNSFLEKGQIDVYPKVGKSGGAFCAPNQNAPTFVLLNHTDTMEQVSTFAHEMGHAIHTELSKSQPVFYQGYSMSTAEVASTLFESFVFEALLEKMSPEQKIAALHTKINDDIQTIFRQIACFNFELDLHSEIRKKGGLSTPEISALLVKNMSAYLGPAVEMKPEDGFQFVSWSHIRNFFYVYSYAFGQLISKALYVKYKEDKKFITKINQFLTAGGSDSPENIFKSIGIDVTKPDFWKKGLQSIEKDIDMLEKLTKNR
jgi:oligoendopeptidase F